MYLREGPLHAVISLYVYTVQIYGCTWHKRLRYSDFIEQGVTNIYIYIFFLNALQQIV